MADARLVPNAGCFLCGRPGATPVTSSQPQSSASKFQFDCAICGLYEIHSILRNSGLHTGPNEFQNGAEFDKDTGIPDMESAAIEHWTKTLEVAERQRRLPRRLTEPEAPNTDSTESACA